MLMRKQESRFSIRLSRRDFLLFTGTAIGVGALGTATPEAQAELPHPYPAAGWLETAHPKRPALLNVPWDGRNPLETSCRFFFHHAAEVRQALYHAYSDAFQTTYDSPPRMGDLLAKHIGYAKQALYDIHGDPDPSIANAAHLATYSLATYLSPYLLMRDVAKLSDAADPTASPLGIRFSDQDLDMHAEDYFHRSLPRLFPVKPAPSTTETDRVKRYEGSDRSVHGASHMFLAGLYYYARQNGLQDATRIPLAAQARISVDTFFSPTDEAKALALSRLAGYMWEVQESGKYIREAGVYYGWSKWFAAGAVPPPLRGLPFIDPLVENDYQANEFGAHLGISLNRPDLSDQTLTQIMTRINADDLYAA